MPNLRDIRRRIRGVKSTQQVTRAMKIVAAAKMRRAQERILAARPYASRMLQVLNSLATRANPEEHPLLWERPPRRVEVIVITADNVAEATAPMAVAAIRDHAGSYGPGFALLVGLAVLGAVSVAFLPKGDPVAGKAPAPTQGH